MRADRITVGHFLDLGAERAPAEVVDIEHDGEMVALRLRQEGKQRGCWVAMSRTEQLRRATEVKK